VDEVIVSVPDVAQRTVGEGPGPDAVEMEIYCARNDRAGGVPISGAIEILFFDGAVDRKTLPSAKPFHVERFPNSLLRGNPNSRLREAFNRRFGVLYRGVVPWGPVPPSGKVVTLVARYIPPSGPPVVSAPTDVALRLP
jgi:hypothetical protein